MPATGTAPRNAPGARRAAPPAVGTGLGRVAATAAWVALAVVVAASGSFAQAVSVGWLPVGVVVFLGLTLVVVAAAGLAAASRAGAAAALAAWLLTVFLLSFPRAEGDVALAAVPTAYVWLYGGSVLGGLCVALDYRRLARRMS